MITRHRLSANFEFETLALELLASELPSHILIPIRYTYGSAISPI